MNPKLFRGLTVVSSFLLATSVMSATLMEKYSTQMDQTFGTLSMETRYEKVEDGDESDAWNYKSKFRTAAEAVEGFKDFAIRESQESVALLKNENNALPLSKTAKITMMGLRSYAPVYGNSAGSMADKNTIENGNTITEIFKRKGFDLNPEMLKAYETYCSTLTMPETRFGAPAYEYSEITLTDKIPELSLSELAAQNPNYNSKYSEYGDAAIVVVGRPGGESKCYYPGQNPETTTGNIMGLSDEEREIIKEAEDHFSKVIVLINSTTTMEYKELRDDPKISGILWIGYPGAYGFEGVADVLNGTVSPSAYLSDVQAANALATPSMQSSGNIPWANASDFTAEENVNSYLVQAEGIYSGYRYYETRYADIVNGVSGAATAKAGTYTNHDGSLATTDGTWNYTEEVVYPFGYGLSYTSFQEEINNVNVAGDKKTAEVTITVKNTGSVAGKKAVQLYAQVPYTDYDRANGVEKSAVQLMDYEKTKTLNPGQSQTITMEVDLSNLASYDYQNAKTFIVEGGQYYFALGNGSHDALNNILAKQGKTTDSGMDYNGNADLVYSWSWNDTDVDSATFRYSETGKEITNQLSEGDYSMDLNSFMPGTVTYLTRQNWNGTFPSSYSGLSAEGRLKTLLKNDFYELKSGETHDVQFGQASDLNLVDLKGAAWDDERYDELASKVTIDEFLDFASHAFHNIQGIPSVGFEQRNADDGPGGSDTHYLNEGKYEGVAYTDPESALSKNGKYLGTRVGTSFTNLAASFNKELAFEAGDMLLGESSLILGLPIMIGPGGNLHRNGYNGRGGEYYSEDPILSGYMGSAMVQGAQALGCLVNIKHAAFNDSEINRSGIAVFENEQKAREMELRNLNAMFTAKGMPASFRDDESKKDTYKQGALGVMSSYNRVGAVASSANYNLMHNIIREEWGFHGYNVTDFTGVSLKAAPKESFLAGTTAFCGFGNPSQDYWNAESLSGDKAMAEAIHENIKYVLYSLANSNALNGVNSSYRAYTVQLPTFWRTGYKAAIGVTTALTVAFVGLSVAFTFIPKKKENN